MNARVDFDEGVLWKMLSVSFAAHVALLAAWPEGRVKAFTQPPRAELAFIDLTPPPAPAVAVPPRPNAGRVRSAAPSKLAAAPSKPAAASPSPRDAAPTLPVALPVFTLPPQSVERPVGPSSTGSDRPGPGVLGPGPGDGVIGPGGRALGGDSEPTRSNEVHVPYPDSARERGVEGSVRLRVTVDASGAVQNVVVLSGPGFGLDEAARKALTRFRFNPALRGGQPVESTFVYTYTFELD